MGYSTKDRSLPLMRSSVHSVRYQEFLKRLRAARKEAGLTQKEVAHQLKVHQSYVSKSESGERRVDIVELSDFARLYQKELDYFISSD